MRKFVSVSILLLSFMAPPSVLFSEECHPYRISWQPVSAPDVTEICIYRSRDDFSNPVMIATVDPSVVEYTDNSTLRSGVVYYYALKSKNSSGSYSAFSAVVSGLTLNESSTPAQQQLCRIDSLSAVNDSTYTVFWSTTEPRTGFVRYINTQTGSQYSSSISLSLSEQHSALLEGLKPNNSYVIKAFSYSQDETSVVVSAEYPFITAIEGDINFVIDNDEITVEEGEVGQVTLSLDVEPPYDVNVSVRRVSGTSTIIISSGSELVFGSGNWNSGEIVEITAVEDIDSDDGYATFVIEAGEGAGIPIRFFTVSAVDNDSPGSGNIVQSSSVLIYPQPFNPAEGSLKLTNLPERGEIYIYNLTGNEVWNTSWSGNDYLEWDGLNSSSTVVTSGRYFLVVRDLENNQIEKKSILIVR